MLLGLLRSSLIWTRVCIAVPVHACRRISSWPAAWGWVVGIFAFAYAAFEIPTDLWRPSWPAKSSDPIVLWWSVFTSLTGAASKLLALIAIRFSFGVGEAGAFPNISSSISRWFPRSERARALACDHDHATGRRPRRFACRADQAAMDGELPLPFGLLGVLWSVFWYVVSRHHPRRWPKCPGRAPGNRRPSRLSMRLAWRVALRS